MTSFVRRLLAPGNSETRSTDLALSLQQWAEQMKFGGLSYALGSQTLTGTTEDIAASFQGYVEGAYKSNGIVFACCVARMLIFSEARFQYQRMRDGKPGDLFSKADLAILETPWPNGTTGDLLSRAIGDVDMAGNSYTVRLTRDRLKRARPDWMTILIGSKRLDWEPGDLDGEVIGYLYHPNGRNSGRDPVPLLPEHVAHWAPIPDPTAEWRGMSWITPIIREIMGDKAAMEHKLKFFDNGATVSLIAKLPESVKADAFKTWVALFKDAHQGTENAYETVFLGGGADLTPVGSDMKQIDFKTVQGHGETRVCAAARIPPIIVGLSEGLEAATYCLPADERVWTLDGPRSIATLRAGDEVWSSGGDPTRPAIVTWQGCVGEKTVYEIRTKNRVLRATDNHPVLVRVAGNSLGHNCTRAPRTEWRCVGELRRGDQVVEALSMPDADGVQPEWASLELVQWLGAYVGDGCGAGRGCISMSIPPTDRVRATYEALTAELFDARIGYEPRSFRFHSKGVSEMVATLGFAGTAKTKRIPGWVFRLPLAQRLAFLAGLIDTDGHIDRRGVGSIGFANRELLEQVRALCWSCGVQTSNVIYRRQMASGLPNPGIHDSYDFWAVALTTGLGKVPTADPIYRERLANRRDAREGGDAWKAGMDPDRLGFFAVRSIEPCGVEPVYDISVDGEHSFFAGGVAVHNSNYGQARRAFADSTMRPLWRGFAGALASIVTVPPDARLWYDAEDVAFLQEDVKDAADIQQTRAVSIRQLIEAGFTPESVVDAIDADDMRRLKHTGLFSVQLQEPGTDHPNPSPIPAVSGQNGRRLLEEFVASTRN